MADIAVMNADGSDLTVIDDAGGSCTAPSWLDSDTLIFECLVEEAENFDVCTANIDGSDFECLGYPAPPEAESCGLIYPLALPSE